MQKKKILYTSAAAATVLALVVGLPLYAINLSDDFGRSVKFTPLVRHMVSQVHCYDTGTDDCETTDHLGTDFTKEHTTGFLFNGSRSRMRARGFEPLYICKDRGDSGAMMVTAGTTEDNPKRACRNEDFRPKRAGYISASSEIEAPWELFRCTHPDTNDTLLTHDPGECSAQAYAAAESLGYLFAGGSQVLN